MTRAWARVALTFSGVRRLCALRARMAITDNEARRRLVALGLTASEATTILNEYAQSLTKRSEA